ncbi:MAG: M23 family metallopeptidase [Hyphomicrobiaceae bacterium]
MVKGHQHSTHSGVGLYGTAARPRGLPQVYRGRARKTYRDIYESDQTETPQGGRFRWLMSTCLAGLVGSVAIIAVVFGTTEDNVDATNVLMPAISGLATGNINLPNQMPQAKRARGLNWSTPKSNSLEVISGTTSTRYVIYESQKQRRNGREYIHAKPYARIVARLSRNTKEYDEVIPPFNPFKLYANDKPVTANNNTDEHDGGTNTNVKIRVVELLGGILPGEDGQELDNSEVKELVEQAEREELAPGELRNALAEEQPLAQAELDQDAADGIDLPTNAPPNTTVLEKSVLEIEATDGELEGRQKRIVGVGVNDTLAGILENAGADKWQAETMIEPLANMIGNGGLSEGQQVHITLVPSLTEQNKLEPAQYSIYDAAQTHVITVARNEAGQFVTFATPFAQQELAQAQLAKSSSTKSTSLYRSIFHASLLQNVPQETIMKILKVHAYETDFRRRITAGDTVEFFFDPKDSKAIDGPPGELLFTKITTGGKESRFYRYRTTDGVVDYYDDKGNNSKQFLMRRPVRSSDVRLTSGFGLRFHPLLNKRRMHNGVDWAARRGTPILAAGNGVVQHAGRKGHYGKYIRIRHANGYETAYGHMSRITRGLKPGMKVRQGQVIGYVGSTGLSSGPHLHFEVLVNKRFVNPMSIQVPRARQLKGHELASFQKERARIDNLMRRAPVMTASK